MPAQNEIKLLDEKMTKLKALELSDLQLRILDRARKRGYIPEECPHVDTLADGGAQLVLAIGRADYKKFYSERVFTLDEIDILLINTLFQIPDLRNPPSVPATG